MGRNMILITTMSLSSVPRASAPPTILHSRIGAAEHPAFAHIGAGPLQLAWKGPRLRLPM